MDTGLRFTLPAAFLAAVGTAASPAFGSQSFTYSDASGLAAVAEFSLIDSTTLQVRYRNTSTAVPEGFSRSDQILTSITWDFGHAGPDFRDPLITGGTMHIGENSYTVGFDTGEYGPGTDVSGEYGYSNSGFSGLMQNYLTATLIEATPFGGPNLDGPLDIVGPQGGLISEPFIPLGNIGAIQAEVVATLLLSAPIFDLDFLAANGTGVEFGNDAFFMQGAATPSPGAFGLLLIAGLGRRRRRVLR